MGYTLLVCADCWGEKVNLELAFPQQPSSVPELTAHVEQVFANEMQVLKPAGAPAHQFSISRIQVYDDVLLKWADLQNAQLHEYDQLYCFQPQSPWQMDQQKDLPAPRPPSGAAVGAPFAAAPAPAPAAPAPSPWAPGAEYAPQPQAAPQQYASPAVRTNSQLAPLAQGLPQATGAAQLARERPNIPVQERVAIAFQEMDEGNKGYLTQSELERGFRSRGIDFSTNTAGELFLKGDTNQDQRLDGQEWAAFAAIYPNTVDACYYRGRDIQQETGLRDALMRTQQELDAGRQQEQNLRAQADQQSAANQDLARQLQDNEGLLRQTTERRNLLENQERALIEQEVKLERQKDALRHSMSKFKETADAFDRDAAGHGSPRRSRQPDLHPALGL